MVRTLLVVAALYSSMAWSMPDRAVAFVEDTLAKGRTIFDQNQGEPERASGLCSLLQERLGTNSLSDLWLGQYGGLEREQAAVPEFKKMIPAIVMSKLISILSGELKGGYTVDPISQEHEQGLYEVGVTFETDGGSYQGSAFVQALPEGMRVVDITYFGISAAGYLGRDYHRILDQEYAVDPEHSLPVEALMRHIRSQTGFRECP